MYKLLEIRLCASRSPCNHRRCSQVVAGMPLLATRYLMQVMEGTSSHLSALIILIMVVAHESDRKWIYSGPLGY